MKMNKIDLNNLDKSTWSTFRFDQIASSISERIDPNNTDLKYYIGLEHLDSENIHITRMGSPDDVNGQKLRCYPGDVIFARRRAYQRKAAVCEVEGFCSAHSLVLRANPEIVEPKLFPFFLHSDAFMHRAVDISVGSLSPTINWGTLKKQEFLIPPKKQQAQLSELLWAMDAVIKSSNNFKKHLYAAKKSFYRDKIRGVPFEPLENVAKVSYGLGQPPEKDESGVAVIRATDIQRGHINEGKFLRVKRSAIPKGKSVELEHGDIIIVRSGAYTGDLAMIPQHLEGSVAGYDLIIRPNRDAINSVFLAEYLLDDIAQTHFKGESIRSAQPHLNSKQVSNTKIPKLALSDQNDIAAEVLRFGGLIKSNNEKKDTSMLLQKNLINQVF